MRLGIKIVSPHPRNIFEFVPWHTARLPATAAAEDASNAGDTRKSGAVAGVESDMVFTMANVFGCEEVEFGTTITVGPPLYDIEHVTVEFAILIPKGGVVEDSGDVIQDLVDWNVRMLPRKDNTGRNVLEDCGCNLAGRFIKDVGEMIFA